MKKFATKIIALAMLSLICSCNNQHTQKSEKKIPLKAYQKLLQICPAVSNNTTLVYYFDGSCAICLAKASFTEKYADAGKFKLILIGHTPNPAEFQYNIQKLNIHSCVHIEQNREFEKDLEFSKVIKIDVDRNVEDIDKEIDNN